jgi:hypothetical protein
MYRHGPTCLDGPVSRNRSCWREVSGGGPALAEEAPEFRADLVARVRREIAAGTYDTPEKLEAALRIMLARLDEE